MYEQRASLVAIEVLSEGCQFVMRNHVKDVLPLVLPFIDSDSPMVRETACLALGQLADNLKPGM